MIEYPSIQESKPTHDNVGRVISHLNKGIEEERYTDAAFLRHKAGAGLSMEDMWQGVIVLGNLLPLLLVFLCLNFFLVNKKGEYKWQDVYLKRGGGAHTSLIASSKISNPTERLSSVESHEGRNKSTKIRGQCPVDRVIFDLAKFIGREKVPSKVLKDVGELTSQTLSQAQNHQPLSGSTIFNRIEISAFSDPSDLEFYEYVEAFKLTGDPYVPAGRYCFGLLYV
ncbi:hypothetical protein K1719_045155 [Acacia pycnantha]|nr:hypothetical protein K1719_045155 [Acacia pycnantha]